MKKEKTEQTKYLQQLEEWIERKREFDIIDLFTRLHPADIADLIDNLREEDKVRLFALLDIEKASDVISELSDASREQILEDISDKKLTEIVDEMESDDAADLIADLTEEQVKTVLAGIEEEDSEDVKKLLKYKEDSAGGIMQTELCSVQKDATVRDAVQTVIKASEMEEIESVYNVFVVDGKNRLIGTVPLQKLLTTKPTVPVSNIIDRTIPSVNVDMDQEKVAMMFKKYDLVSLPVVDYDGRLLGRITVDDIVDVMDEETSEDLYRMAGLGEDDSILTQPAQAIKRRLPWLCLNLVTASLSAFVIGFFEDTIRMMVVLAVFMPVVAGLGGNAGAQSIALIVRGLALGELTFENSKKTLYKQIVVGLANGVIVGVITGIIGYFWKGMPMLGVILGLAMTINIFWGTLIGTLIPISLKWSGMDPALGSNMFVTGLTDAFGNLTFLGLAAVFLKLMT